MAIPGFTAELALGPRGDPKQERFSEDRHEFADVVPAGWYPYPCYQFADGRVGYCCCEFRSELKLIPA
jgi:hypothetical protein